MGDSRKDYLTVKELGPGNDPLTIRAWAAGEGDDGDAQIVYAPGGECAFVLFDIRDYSIHHWGAGMYFVTPGGRQKLFDSGWRFEHKFPLFFQNGRYGYFYLDNIGGGGGGLVRHAEHIFIRDGGAGYEYAAIKVTGERNNHFAVSDDSVEGELEIFFYWIKGDQVKNGEKIRIDMTALPWRPLSDWE